jgi:hypothetical protein
MHYQYGYEDVESAHDWAQTPGDVIGFRPDSGRLHLLAVRALEDTRSGLFPIVDLLDFVGATLADSKDLSRLQRRTVGLQGSPWWKVDGVVLHRRAV